MKGKPLLVLILIVAVALIGRVLLLASGAVSFHSDEAVVGLMARHILQGERPVFFYGQAYMGSLDAWLIAGGFALLGDTVLTIRIVEAILYLLIVITGYLVAWRVSGRLMVAAVAGLALALPTVLLTVYTTATLGGYNETLLFGNLILLLGWDVTHEHHGSRWRWAALGLCAGLGWWTNGLIVAYALPVGVLVLWEMIKPLTPADLRSASPLPHKRGEETLPPGIAPLPARVGEGEANRRFAEGEGAHRRASLRDYAGWIGIALVGFLIGSAPWWVFNFQNEFAALAFYLPNNPPSKFAGMSIPPLSLPERLLSLLALNLPVVLGARFPWYPTYFLPPVALVVLLVYAFALYWLLRRPSILKPGGRLLVVGMIGLFFALFLVSRFSIDPSGRYFLPMALPLGIVLGTLVAAARYAILRIALVVFVIGYQLFGLVSAVQTVPPGITTQFNLDTHIPNDDDQALIDFLEAHDLPHGYTNYWISFRLAFLSDEQLKYSAALSYKPDLSYTPFDDRDPSYRMVTDAAPDAQIAYITANVAAVQQKLEAYFAEQEITYEAAQVGLFHVYYDFQPITPRPPLPFQITDAAG